MQMLQRYETEYTKANIAWYGMRWFMVEIKKITEVIIQYISNMDKMVLVNEPNIFVYYTLPEQTVTTTAEHDSIRNQCHEVLKIP